MVHVVLLGDSVFDNAAYTGGGPDVVAQLRGCLPAGAEATLLAVDGAVSASVSAQVARLPADATHVVISAGGNDALGRAGLLAEGARSVAEVLLRVSDAVDAFSRDYRAMLDAVLAEGLPTAVSTIYDPRFPDPAQRRAAMTALSAFNDRITREAFARGLPLLDLRLICGEDAGFANPIEPSSHGGDKIARAIARLVAEANWRSGRSLVAVR